MNMVHTTVETKDGWTRMVYHGTCVASMRATSYLDPKDPRAGVKVELNTGGFFTKTTKKRMNQFAEMFNLPYRVFQHKGDWGVSFMEKNTEGYMTHVGKEQPFDGDSCEFTVGV